MSNVAVIGRTGEVRAWASAGALVCPAETQEAMRTAFLDLPTGIGLVLLTSEAAAATAALVDRGRGMTVVIP